MRAIILYFRYRHNEEQMGVDQSAPDEGGWFHRRLHWISPKYMYMFFTGTVLVLFLIGLIFQLAMHKPGEYNLLVECMNLQRIPLIITGTYSTFAVTYAAWKILKIRDAFSIKTELTVVACFGPLPFIAWLPVEWLNLIPDQKYILVLGNIGVIFVMLMVYPVYLTFVGVRRQKRVTRILPEDEGMTPVEIFELCLIDDVLYPAFRQHCIESFCVENCLFYHDTLRYLDMDERRRKVEIDNMRSLYLRENARLLINVHGKTRQTLLERIAQGDTSDDLFTEAMKEVSTQMYQDTFPKFKDSVRFKGAWKTLEKKKKGSTRSTKMPLIDSKPKEPFADDIQMVQQDVTLRNGDVV